MSINNATPKLHAPIADSSSEVKSNFSPKNNTNSEKIEEKDKAIFFENISRLECGTPFVEASIERRIFVHQDTAQEGATIGADMQRSITSKLSEDASATLLSDTIVKKYSRDPSLQNMSFTVQNRHGSINVEAAISNGHVRCALSTSSEKLKRRMNHAREQIISSLGCYLGMSVELNIEE